MAEVFLLREKSFCFEKVFIDKKKFVD